MVIWKHYLTKKRQHIVELIIFFLIGEWMGGMRVFRKEFLQVHQSQLCVRRRGAVWNFRRWGGGRGGASPRQLPHDGVHCEGDLQPPRMEVILISVIFDIGLGSSSPTTNIFEFVASVTKNRIPPVFNFNINLLDIAYC